MSSIEVEFFGIARQRIQQPSASVPVDGPIGLHAVLLVLSELFPELVPDCIVDGKLTGICTANLNGDSFLSASDASIRPGDRLLIMSADAGG